MHAQTLFLKCRFYRAIGVHGGNKKEKNRRFFFSCSPTPMALCKIVIQCGYSDCFACGIEKFNPTYKTFGSKSAIAKILFAHMTSSFEDVYITISPVKKIEKNGRVRAPSNWADGARTGDDDVSGILYVAQKPLWWFFPHFLHFRHTLMICNDVGTLNNSGLYIVPHWQKNGHICQLTPMDCC